ncbi:MAG: RNHCP domain-containing protein [Streptosporangiaceae bacterium]
MSRAAQNQGFAGAQCGQLVRPLVNGSYRNHCPACLWSQHVDVRPGDRASPCCGLMESTGSSQAARACCRPDSPATRGHRLTEALSVGHQGGKVAGQAPSRSQLAIGPDTPVVPRSDLRLDEPAGSVCVWPATGRAVADSACARTSP